jgi:hypothetical protein
VKLTILSALLLPFLILNNSALPQDAKRVPIPTGICDVVSTPSRYNRKVIKVRAQVESDGIEHTVLLDAERHCSKGVVPWTRTATDGTDPFAPIDDAIYRQGRIGTIDKKIVATFTGTFRSAKDREHPRTLEIESVSDVEVNILPKNHTTPSDR